MIFIAVLYRESDGTIIQTVMGQRHFVEHTANHLGLSYLEVGEQRDDYDTMYVVHKGKLALKATLTEAS